MVPINFSLNSRLPSRHILRRVNYLSSYWICFSSISSSSSTTTGRSDTGTGTGYQSIGSFHNDNLAEVLSQPEDEYTAPELPFEAQASTLQQADANIKSHRDNRDHFSLNLEQWTFLNHGAFGAALRDGQVRAAQWRTFAETQPLQFHDRVLLPHLAHSARVLARQTLGTSPQALSLIPQLQREDDIDQPKYVLLPNVTTGMNIVLQNYSRHYGKHKGHVILFDTTYGSTKSMARHYVDHVTELGLVPQLSLLQRDRSHHHANDDTHGDSQSTVMEILLRQVLLTSTSSSCPPLLILDHVSSNTALHMNLPNVLRTVRTLLPSETWVVIDGAHGLWPSHDTQSWLPQALGSNHDTTGKDSDKNIGGVDVYLCNGHKWMSAPRGVALAWVASPKARKALFEYPAILSHGMHALDIFSRFVWDGCRDYTAALAVPAVVQFWEQWFNDGSRNHRDASSFVDTMRKGLVHLAHRWHGMPDVENKDEEDYLTMSKTYFARGLCLAPLDWQSMSMTLMRVPLHCENTTGVSTSADAKRLQDYLHHQHRIEVPVKCIDHKLYVRISCHIYNCPTDFERLAAALAPPN